MEVFGRTELRRATHAQGTPRMQAPPPHTDCLKNKDVSAAGLIPRRHDKHPIADFAECASMDDGTEETAADEVACSRIARNDRHVITSKRKNKAETFIV